MRSRFLRSLSVLSLFALAACQTAAHNRQTFDNQRPANEVEVNAILEGMRTYLRDPYSVRDAEISTVATTADLGGGYTSNICVKANTRNAMGGYVGRQTYLVYVRNGRAIGVNQDVFAQGMCNRIDSYRRFVEIERLTVL